MERVEWFRECFFWCNFSLRQFMREKGAYVQMKYQKISLRKKSEKRRSCVWFAAYMSFIFTIKSINIRYSN